MFTLKIAQVRTDAELRTSQRNTAKGNARTRTLRVEDYYKNDSYYNSLLDEIVPIKGGNAYHVSKYVSDDVLAKRNITFDLVAKMDELNFDNFVTFIRKCANAQRKHNTVLKVTKGKLKCFYGKKYKEIDAYIPLRVVLDLRFGQSDALLLGLCRLKFNFVKNKFHKQTMKDLHNWYLTYLANHNANLDIDITEE